MDDPPEINDAAEVLARHFDLSVEQVIDAVQSRAASARRGRTNGGGSKGRPAKVDVDAAHLDAVIDFSAPGVALDSADEATRAQLIDREAKRLVAAMKLPPKDQKKAINEAKKSIRNQLDHHRRTRGKDFKIWIDNLDFDPNED